MKSEKEQAAFSLAGCLFDIVLLYVNSIGIVAALTEILEIPWREIGKKSIRPGLDPVLLWGALLVFCVAAVLIRSGKNDKKVFARVIVFGIAYIFLGIHLEFIH